MRQLLRYLQIAFLLIAPVVLLILPANFFDKGESICLSKVLFDIECYACGLTRAVQHAIHGDFAGAYQYNKLVAVVLPLLFLWWAKNLAELLGFNYQKYFNPRKSAM